MDSLSPDPAMPNDIAAQPAAAYEVVNDPAPAPAPDPAPVAPPAPSVSTGAPAPDPTPAPVAPPAQEAPAPVPGPGTGDSSPEPDHEAPREGAFVDVVSGEYAPLFGVYLATVERNPDGSPDKIIVRNRDHGGTVDLAVCSIDDVRVSARTGGR